MLRGPIRDWGQEKGPGQEMDREPGGPKGFWPPFNPPQNSLLTVLTHFIDFY
jgi:hypothetical protein